MGFLSIELVAFSSRGRKGGKKVNVTSGKKWRPVTPSASMSGRRVAVILAHWNSPDFLYDQLKSLLAQRRVEATVYIFDDHSKPSNLGIWSAQELADHPSVLTTLRARRVGYVKNFLLGLAHADRGSRYFAFSDQDDIWHEDKLERAIATLEQVPSEQPALYCARTEITDATCEHTLGYSPRFNKTPSFANALVQNIGGGNTMVFNRAARDLIINATVDANVVSHDWWCYQIVSGAGGYVVYDPEPCLKYRQHANNLVGANTSWRARFLRIRGLLQGRFRTWNDINLKALSEHSHLLTADNRKILSNFIEARQSSLIKRLFLFKRSGIYCQTLFGNLRLLLGIILNKV